MQLNQHLRGIKRIAIVVIFLRVRNGEVLVVRCDIWPSDLIPSSPPDTEVICKA